MRKEMSTNYDDIINLPRHVSKTRQQMSMHDRAAQFSAFAALTGYEAKIRETARTTDKRPELDESRIARINTCLQILVDKANERPAVLITFFRADEKKSGGAYVVVSGNFRRLDESDETVVLTNGIKIPLEDIYEIDSVLVEFD